MQKHGRKDCYNRCLCKIFLNGSRFFSDVFHLDTLLDKSQG